MNNDEFRNSFLDGIQDTVHSLDACDRSTVRKCISGHLWYCLIGSTMDLFYNSVLSDSFEYSEKDSFRWIGQMEGQFNPTLCSIRKTKKKNVYSFHWVTLFEEKGIVGKTLKFVLLEDRIKRLHAEQYQKDGNKYDSSNEWIYEKIYIDSIMFSDKVIRESKAYVKLKKLLCIGIISMYQALEATCVCTDYSGGVLAFPIENEKELNMIFKYRDVEEGNKRRSPVFAVVKEHTRNGNQVERHVRAKGFVYNGRNFGLLAGTDAMNNQFDVHDNKRISLRAAERLKKAATLDCSDTGLIFAKDG